MLATTEHAIHTTNHRDVWAWYLAELDASARTRDTYRKALKRYAAWLAENNLELSDTDRAQIIAYRDYLKEQLKPASVNLYLAAVRSFYSWAESLKLYPNVAANVKGLKTAGKTAKQSLTAAQARDLCQPTGDTLGELRDHAMLTLMVHRGLRTCEVSRANIGDICMTAGGAALYVQGKGKADKGEFVMLGEEVLAPLMAYLKARGCNDQDAPLFASIGNRNQGGRMTTRTISRIAKQALERIGICSPAITAHSLRHTAITLALMGGATVQEAQGLARHRDISTTMIYAHNLDRMSGKAEAAIDRIISAARAA